LVASNPGSRARRLRRLRRNSPEPVSSSSESATWTTTRVRRSRPRPPAIEPACSLSAPTRSGRDTWSAGSRPKRIAASAAATKLKTRTRPSTLGEIASRICSSGASSCSPRMVQYDTARPAMAPIAARTKLSTRSWRTMRRRPAPSPSRIEISRSRAAARATSRFDTLAQAMTRTRPTSAARILSGTSSARRTSE
jgi:hypothetical protein